VLQLRHEIKEQEDLLASLEELQADNNRLTLENNRIKVSWITSLYCKKGAWKKRPFFKTSLQDWQSPKLEVCGDLG